MQILNIDRMEPLDIILVRFPGDENSEKIRKVCASNFSHAMIHIRDGSCIEGIDPVVTLFSYHRYYFENLENVRVLRLKDEYKSKFDYKKAEEFIRKLAFCNYSRRLLLYMERKNISSEIIMDFLSNQIWQGGIVCTTLITLPYYIGGLDISQRNEPYYANFNDIENYSGFEDVTAIAFEEIEETQLRKDAFDYLTTSETGTLLEKQSSIAGQLNQYVSQKYRDILSHPEKYADINVIPENLKFTTWEDIYPNIMRWYLTETGRTIDNELSNLIISTGYDRLWFEEIHLKKEQYFPVYYRWFDNMQKEDFEFMINMFQSTLDRMEESEKSVFHNFSLCPCKTFHLLLEMYRSFADSLRTTIDHYKALLKFGTAEL
jgi:hypothetical protein